MTDLTKLKEKQDKECRKYQIIYADPPWSYNDKMGNDSAFMSATSAYNTMPVYDIKALKVENISDTDCVLFLWVVSPLLREAFEVMTAWGFKYKTIAFCWSKQTKTGRVVSNMGRWTMGNVELCLLGTKGSPKRIIKDIKQLVIDTRQGHSKKPDVVRQRIVELMGELPRIELFARNDGGKNLFNENPLDGWDAWGNEVESDINITPS